MWQCKSRVLSLADLPSSMASTTNGELSSYVSMHCFLKIRILVNQYLELPLWSCLVDLSMCRSSFGASDKGLHCLELEHLAGTGSTAMRSCVKSTVAAPGKEFLYQCITAMLVISSWV